MDGDREGMGWREREQESIFCPLMRAIDVLVLMGLQITLYMRGIGIFSKLCDNSIKWPRVTKLKLCFKDW